MRVTAVASGRELDDAMARDTVDIVVLDVRLHGEDGMQIARRLRERSAIPILMLTGRHEKPTASWGLELGADDYLTKPFSTRELLARIRALLRRAQAQASVADAMARVRAYRFAGWELNVGLRRLKNPGRRGGRSHQRRVQPARRRSSRRRSARSRATSCSSSRACTTPRSTTARSTSRSCACAGRSKPIRRTRASSSRSAAPGYVFDARRRDVR
jgi:CheY-like chemotaxis protein